jgi:hypothetical protein
MDSIAKLEPFLLIAKSVKGAAAAKLIQDTTAANGVFVFTELLELPNIQQVTVVLVMLDSTAHTLSARTPRAICTVLCTPATVLIQDISRLRS